MDIKNIRNWINRIVLLLAVITALAIGALIADDWLSPRVDYTMHLFDGWTRINEDGSYEEVIGPLSIGNSVPSTFLRTLPDNLDDSSVLRFKCPYYSVDAYIDGELIYHVGPGKLGNITTTIGNVYVLIPLKSEYSGKVITLTVQPRSNFSAVRIKEAAISSMADYSFQRILDALPFFVLSIVIVIISIISIVMFIPLQYLHGDSSTEMARGFMWLAIFGVLASTWIISDFHIIGMLTGRMILSGVINYIAFMLCPLIFSQILIKVVKDNLFFKILLSAAGFNVVLQVILFVTGLNDLPEGFIASRVITLLLISGMLVSGVFLVKKFASRSMILMAIPAGCFTLSTVGAAVSYYLNADWMLFVAFALTFYSFTMIFYLLINLWNALKENIKLEHVTKVAYHDQLTDLENRHAYSECLDELRENQKNGTISDKLTIILLDINGLKKANDSLGHTAGDELITGAAKCIREILAVNCRTFRTGGDEFVVIGEMTEAEYNKRARKLEEVTSSWDGLLIDNISLSKGMVTRSEFPECTISQLLEIADKRMYEDKQSYYTSMLLDSQDTAESREEGDKSERKFRYFDGFALNKYTMPIVRQMAEVIPGGFFIYKENETRELIYLNKKVRDIYGCDSVEEFRALTGFTFEGMVYPEDFAKIQDSIDKQIDAEDGDSMDHVIYRIVRKDGEIRWVDDYGHYSHSRDYGDIYYVFISDITDRIK